MAELPVFTDLRPHPRPRRLRRRRRCPPRGRTRRPRRSRSFAASPGSDGVSGDPRPSADGS